MLNIKKKNSADEKRPFENFVKNKNDQKSDFGLSCNYLNHENKK